MGKAAPVSDPAALLRAWRGREELSLAGAAQLFDCTRAAVHALETGLSRSPSLALGVAIRDIAKIPVELWLAEGRP